MIRLSGGLGSIYERDPVHIAFPLAADVYVLIETDANFPARTVKHIVFGVCTERREIIIRCKLNENPRVNMKSC